MITKIIPTLKRHGFPTDKVDFLIAMGENLIQMKSSTDMQKLEGLTDASTNAKTDPAHNFESSSLEFTQHIRNTNSFQSSQQHEITNEDKKI